MPSKKPRFPWLLLVLAACGGGGGGGGAPGLGAGRGIAALPGPAESGAQCALAAAYLALDLGRAGLPGAPLAGLSGATAAEMRAHADAVLRALFLESGLAVPSLRSPWLARRARSPSAPKDRNGKGGNLDETLARLRALYEFRTNAPLPRGLAAGFLLPPRFAARLARSPRARDDLTALRLAPPSGPRSARPRAFGEELLALTRRAAHLLALGRGDLYGARAEDGMIGLLLLEQALALERFLVEQVLFDGRSLTGAGDPKTYDPAKSPRLHPAWISYEVEPGEDGLGPRPALLRAAERGAFLDDQAALLRGFAALAALASPQQPNPLLRRLFEGDPFGRAPGIGAAGARRGSARARAPGAGTGPGGVNEPRGLVTWDRHVKGLLQARCTGCHFPGKAGGFSVGDYDSVLRGGNHRATHPTVVKGAHEKSLLWRILTPTPPKGFNRMPKFGPFLTGLEVDLIRDWIDAGAPKSDPGRKEVEPEFGLDGLRLVLRNLKAFFLDPASGALVERADLGGRGLYVDAGALGLALTALTEAKAAAPAELEAAELLGAAARFAAGRLIDGAGRVRAGYDLVRDAPEARPADGEAAAALAGGLAAAGYALGDEGLKRRARAALARWRAVHIAADGGLLPFAGVPARLATARGLAHALEALAAWARIGGPSDLPRLAEGLVRWYERHGGVLAEWPDAGEPLADGAPDSDRDGIPEVGSEGRPPLFAGGVADEDGRRGRGFPARRPRFSRDLLPAFLPLCGACHMGGARKGDFALDTFADLFRGGAFRDRFPILTPGRPEASLLYLKLARRAPPFGVQMPLGFPPAPAALRARLAAWIEAGARRD